MPIVFLTVAASQMIEAQRSICFTAMRTTGRLRIAINRAIAGLSMGGVQAPNIALAYAADFSYVGVFS